MHNISTMNHHNRFGVESSPTSMTPHQSTSRSNEQGVGDCDDDCRVDNHSASTTETAASTLTTDSSTLQDIASSSSIGSTDLLCASTSHNNATSPPTAIDATVSTVELNALERDAKKRAMDQIMEAGNLIGVTSDADEPADRRLEVTEDVGGPPIPVDQIADLYDSMDHVFRGKTQSKFMRKGVGEAETSCAPNDLAGDGVMDCEVVTTTALATSQGDPNIEHNEHTNIMADPSPITTTRDTTTMLPVRFMLAIWSKVHYLPSPYWRPRSSTM